jgi:GTPase SAR1 family protein
MSQNNFKIVLVGDNQTGKTSWIKWFLNSYIHNDNYVSTLGVNVYQDSRYGINLNIWDTSGLNSPYCGLRDGYYINGDCFVIFGDNIFEYEQLINTYFRNFNKSNIPIIFKNNKTNDELLIEIINKINNNPIR